MLKTTGYDIVFQEIPDETTLAINFSNCPNKCVGCHSPYLWEDIGQPFTQTLLQECLARYKNAVTCVAFMGGDREPGFICDFAKYVKQNFPGLKTAWYSGKENLPTDCNPLECFDYIKLGPYKQKFGCLKSETTNQRLYKVHNKKDLEDVTHLFWRKK